MIAPTDPPPDLPLDLVADPRGTLLAVKAQPNARRPGILGAHGGAVRVGVAAAPERGKATHAVAAALAAALGCRAARVVLIAGATGRAKRFLILAMDPAAVRARLARAAAPARSTPNRDDAADA